jgi:hypothetical protein
MKISAAIYGFSGQNTCLQQKFIGSAFKRKVTLQIGVGCLLMEELMLTTMREVACQAHTRCIVLQPELMY